MLRTATMVSLAATSGVALAQPAITVEIDEPVLLPGESTTVTLLAGFDSSDFAIATIGFDFMTSVGSDGWSEAELIRPMDFFGMPGVPTSTGYDDVLANQINSAAIGGPSYADTTNPIPFWRATYTAPSDVRGVMEVDLSTVTNRYDVYVGRLSWIPESRLDELVEGSGTIAVIPAPASAVVLALGVVRVRRRR
mgnify:CR=1 FL=1